MSFFQDFLSLIYPNLCLSCRIHLKKQENFLCLYCSCNLPKTDYADHIDNKTEKLLWGRIDFVSATSYLYFSKKGLTQRILHQIKYKNQPDLAIEMGELMGVDFLNSNRFNTMDYIIPVPLHGVKEKERGYNQSQKISEGICNSTSWEVLNKHLIRKTHHSSQTRKTRMERWKNVDNIFKVENPADLENKNVLLIDDVITTGATLEACANELNKISGLKLYVATLAIPVN